MSLRGATKTGVISRALAGILAALCVGGGGDLLAAPLEPVVPEERPAVEKAIDKLGVKIGEKIDAKLDEKIGEGTVEAIDEAHDDQVRFIGLFFENIDRAFGEQYVEDRERKVRVRAGLETTFNAHGTSVDTKVKIVLRVPLPAMKRRFNAFVDFGGDLDQLGDVSAPDLSASDKAFTIAAGLVRRFRDDLEAGLKLKLFRKSGAFFSLHPFIRLEKKRDSMRYYFQQQVIWESDNSWSTLTDFDVDRRFDSGIFLRQRNRIEYSFEDPGASVAHGLMTRRSVFEDNGLSLELWLEYNTARDDPEIIEDDTIVYAQLRLRGRIWRNWLEYELRPIYTFPINTDRKSFFGFFVSLAVVWDSHLGGDVSVKPDRETER